MEVPSIASLVVSLVAWVGIGFFIRRYLIKPVLTLMRMNGISNEVELRPAFVWFCDACGHENFGLMDVEELTRDEARQRYRNMRGIGEFDEIPDGTHYQNCYAPRVVACSACGTRFNSVTSLSDISDQAG